MAPGVRVSTVFLGLDHNWGDGPPLLFESMIFWPDNPDLDQQMARYSTWHEAEQGHERLVECVRQALSSP